MNTLVLLTSYSVLHKLFLLPTHLNLLIKFLIQFEFGVKQNEFRCNLSSSQIDVLF